MPQKRLTTNGNVFRRTDGRWQSVIWYFDEQGIERRRVFSSKTKTEAQQKITTYIAQFNEEVRNSDESQKTLKDSLTHWLQVFKFPSVERTTYDRLECTAQHQVYPLIGDKIVGDITAADLKSVFNHWMEQGYAYTTVKKVHILLNEYFRYLTEEGFIQKNPMQSVPMMKKANFLAAQDKECLPEQEAVTVFTPTEIAKFKREVFSTFANGKRKYQQAAAYILMLNTGLPTLRFCLPEGRYLVIRQVGPLFRRLGHLCYGMAEFQRLVDCHWYSWAGYYDYWNGRLAIPPQYHSIRNDGEFTAAGYAIVRGKSDWFDGEWQKNYMLIDRTGHNTSGNIFQKIGMVDTSDFSMFDPYDELLGYSVRMGTKYGFADYTGQLIVPCQYEREIHLFPVAGQYQFVQWEEGHGVVPLPEAGPGEDALYQAIQRHWEQKTLEQRPDPLGESAEHFLRETGLFEEPIRKEQGRDPARPNRRHFRVMLQPGCWAILRCTWLESG